MSKLVKYDNVRDYLIGITISNVQYRYCKSTWSIQNKCMIMSILHLVIAC